MKLRPFLLLSGTVTMEGGDQTERVRGTRTGGEVQHLVVRRRVTPDRKRANTIATTVRRDVRRLSVLTTPWGTLIPLERHAELRDLLAKTSRTVAEFNKGATTTQLVNALTHDHLSGAILASVEGWIEKRLRARDAKVCAAEPELRGIA
jgi:hypothetical protein